MKRMYYLVLLNTYRFRFVAIAIVLVLCYLFEPKAHSMQVSCENKNIILHSHKSEDAKLGCQGALSAVHFLSSLGVEVRKEFELRIVDRLPGSRSSSVLGYYDHETRCAYLLSYLEANKKGTPYGIPLDTSLYISMAAHEGAHIVIAQNFSFPQPHIEAREYIAYVTMFSVMPTNLRDRLFKTILESAFETEKDIVGLVYLSNPPVFGVKAYKHFSGLEDKRAFIQQVLRGQALNSDIFY